VAGKIRRSVAVVAALIGAALLIGCGGAIQATDEGRVPKASPREADVGRTQEPGRGRSREISAHRRGQRACSGLTPLEAAERYRSAALKAGVTRRFAALVVEPSSSVEQSLGYPRLVGAFYATTVAGPERREAASGCAEELTAAGERR
jgi:hypothetical protein